MPQVLGIFAVPIQPAVRSRGLEENWPELKKNPTDAEGKVIEAERKWSMPLPGVAK